MLQPVCEKVFICCNDNQAATIQTGYEILIDDDYHSELNQILTDLREISTETSYLEIIDDLQNDLDYYHSKTLSQILDVLEN